MSKHKNGIVKKVIVKKVIVGLVIVTLVVGGGLVWKNFDKIKDKIGINKDKPVEKPTEPVKPDEPLVYKVTYQIGDEETSQDVAVGGSPVEPKAPTKEGYVFEGWMLDGEIVENTEKVLIIKDTVFIAKFSKLHQVTFAVGDETTTNTVKDGDKIVFPEIPIKEGYTVDGWLDGDKLIEDTNNIKASKDVTYTVKYTQIHTVTFNIQDQTVNKTVRDNEYINGIPVVDIADYDFDGWTNEEGEIVKNLATTPITSDMIFTAKLTKLHTVSIRMAYDTHTEKVRDGECISLKKNYLKNGDLKINFNGKTSYFADDKEIETLDNWYLKGGQILSIDSNKITLILENQYAYFNQTLTEITELVGKTITVGCKVSNTSVSNCYLRIIQTKNDDTSTELTTKITGDGIFSHAFKVLEDCKQLQVQIYAGVGEKLNSMYLEGVNLVLGEEVGEFVRINKTGFDLDRWSCNGATVEDIYSYPITKDTSIQGIYTSYKRVDFQINDKIELTEKVRRREAIQYKDNVVRNSRFEYNSNEQTIYGETADTTTNYFARIECVDDWYFSRNFNSTFDVGNKVLATNSNGTYSNLLHLIKNGQSYKGKTVSVSLDTKVLQGRIQLSLVYYKGNAMESIKTIFLSQLLEEVTRLSLTAEVPNVDYDDLCILISVNGGSNYSAFVDKVKFEENNKSTQYINTEKQGYILKGWAIQGTSQLVDFDSVQFAQDVVLVPVYEKMPVVKFVSNNKELYSRAVYKGETLNYKDTLLKNGDFKINPNNFTSTSLRGETVKDWEYFVDTGTTGNVITRNENGSITIDNTNSNKRTILTQYLTEEQATNLFNKTLTLSARVNNKKYYCTGTFSQVSSNSYKAYATKNIDDTSSMIRFIHNSNNKYQIDVWVDVGDVVTVDWVKFELNITATPNIIPQKAGYNFIGWTIDGVTIVEDISTLEITADTTFTAIFEKVLEENTALTFTEEQKEYILSKTASPAEGGTALAILAVDYSKESQAINCLVKGEDAFGRELYIYWNVPYVISVETLTAELVYEAFTHIDEVDCECVEYFKINRYFNSYYDENTNCNYLINGEIYSIDEILLHSSITYSANNNITTCRGSLIGFKNNKYQLQTFNVTAEGKIANNVIVAQILDMYKQAVEEA